MRFHANIFSICSLVISFRTGKSDDIMRNDQSLFIRRRDQDIFDGNILRGDDDSYDYLTTCIGPYMDYIPGPDNYFRVPRGEAKIVFDGGGGRFNYISKGKYPGYDPKLEFTFSYVLKGLQDHCKNCRIQIHQGDTCDKPSIRYFNKNVEGAYNPWRIEYDSVYTSNRAGETDGSFGMFDGFNYEEHKRKTVVVWDGEERIGCGVLRVRDLGLCDYDIDYPDSGTGGSSKGSPTPTPHMYESPTAKPIFPPPTPASKGIEPPNPASKGIDPPTRVSKGMESPTRASKGIENGNTVSSDDEKYTGSRKGGGRHRRHNGDLSQKGKKR
mmetsp:Transcript_30610/g.46972  ORF Transcript_30610/g.46972 Transcript_30610/m.46972 type:complete len:326 (+) Transcript_30610:133-1110(+)